MYVVNSNFFQNHIHLLYCPYSHFSDKLVTLGQSSPELGLQPDANRRAIVIQ